MKINSMSWSIVTLACIPVMWVGTESTMTIDLAVSVGILISITLGWILIAVRARQEVQQ